MWVRGDDAFAADLSLIDYRYSYLTPQDPPIVSVGLSPLGNPIEGQRAPVSINFQSRPSNLAPVERFDGRFLLPLCKRAKLGQRLARNYQPNKSSNRLILKTIRLIRRRKPNSPKINQIKTHTKPTSNRLETATYH
ncbi:uncharacterized protein PgNI_01371 [Pyricularia grisea]|uniref:Uncharacterized protein n=1 Tax=Pyricularia grisea TaxID=148305 RepID=A0A6P8BJ72_PYRGI|nr:uncharacterized protein PgNI_01371 [Pyricularia grisea]TLD16838.1 hypothetical protein PgNI_01371 [Pyricularia grisea]